MEKGELIFAWGLEGGGEDVFGEKDSSGNWQTFWIEGSSLVLDENDDDIVNSWKSEKVKSIEEVMSLLYKDWWTFTVFDIHPEFETKISNYVNSKKSD